MQVAATYACHYGLWDANWRVDHAHIIANLNNAFVIDALGGLIDHNLIEMRADWVYGIYT